MYSVKLLSTLLIYVFIGCSSNNNIDNVIDSEEPIIGEKETGEDPPSLKMEFDPSYNFIYSENKVKDRNFYWSTLVENDDIAKSAIENDTFLSNFLQAVKSKVTDLSNRDNLTAQEYATQLKFDEEEKTEILVAIRDLANSSRDSFESVNSQHIQVSGVFNRFESINDAARIHQLIVGEMIDGINRIIDTYVAGLDPRYPELDRVSYDVNSPEYTELLKDLLKQIADTNNSQTLFYQPILDFALGAMSINQRDEAGRFVSLKSGENKATLEEIRNIKWDDYPYSMIVILGDAPNSPGDLPNISIGGMQRCDRGMELFSQGLAPIIAFTGANVAPFQSEFHEAIEMKKYVLENYDISENRVLVDPHARHTTTNLRNVGRLIYRYGLPPDKKAIVSTIASQSEYLSSNQYATRCMNEIGHIPMELHQRLSDLEIEFTPREMVLHLDSNDPLDP